jgi:hypothetical protein
MTNLNLNLSLDHFLIGTSDLEKSVEWFSALTGVTPSFGGIHPGAGTANYLVSLGEGGYLELIGSIPGEKPRDLGAAFSDFPEAELFWFAARPMDISAHSGALNDLGITTAGLFTGSRRSTDGTELTWDILEFGKHVYGGFVPFMIDWKDTPHPSATVRPAVSFNAFKVAHPRADRLRRIYRAIGLDVDICEGAAKLELILDTPEGGVSLTGTGSMPWFQSSSGSVFNRNSSTR